MGYSKINNPMLRHYKHTGDDEIMGALCYLTSERKIDRKNLSKKEFEDLYEDAEEMVIERYWQKFKTPHSEYYFLKKTLFRMFGHIKRKDFKNFFIENDVLHIIENVTFKMDEHFESMFDKVYNLDKSERNDFTGFIYTKNDPSALAFNILRTKNDMGLGVSWDNGADIYGSVIFSDINTFSSSNNESGNIRALNIIVNLVYYLNAYPGCVMEQPPDEVIDKLNKNNSHQITISDELKPYLSKEMLPHLRRGHFRYLGSDYFKKKRGQTVFIHPVFVGGEAKTVIKTSEHLN